MTGVSYYARMDVPGSGKVVYDGENECIKTLNYKQSGADGEFVLTSPDLKFKLVFDYVSGELLYFEYDKCRLENFADACVCIDSFVDGYVVAEPYDLYEGCKNYICAFFDRNIEYDRKNNTLLFGRYEKNQAVFRVLENLFVLMGENDSITGIAIKL